MRCSSKSSRVFVASCASALLVTALGLFYYQARSDSSQPLVVYCAHDALYSEKILRGFEQQTGIPLSIRYDTEATKSLGLVSLLISEKDHPRCDLFWNNQALGTADLQRHGLLLPYQGSGFERIPARFKDADGHWTGFAARLRVYIVNTDKMAATQQALHEALKGDLSRMAIAKPLYGTTLSHYSLLWHLWGGEKLKVWHRDLSNRGVIEVAGNATVKNLVAQGACDFGLTDTDDFFVAQDEGKPVAMLPVKVHDHTICIPNTVAIIKGTKKLPEAQRLVDFLLCEETELALAASRSRQIPLGPIAKQNEHAISADVLQLLSWAKMGYDLSVLSDARSECLDWLKSEYLQ